MTRKTAGRKVIQDIDPADLACCDIVLNVLLIRASSVSTFFSNLCYDPPHGASLLGESGGAMLGRSFARTAPFLW